MAYLPETVRSVQMQVDVVYEHIFVDGNSSDGTLEYIKSLKGDIQILEGVGGGIARAMNVGVRAATGDVIAHLHSDDYYLDAAILAKVIAAFNNSSNKWLFGRIMSDVNGALLAEGYEVPRFSYKRFLRGNFIPHPATFVRREVFEEYGYFSEALRYAMDYDFFLRVAKHCPPIQFDEYLTAFRRHEGSATQANYMKSFTEDYKVRCNHSLWYQLPEATFRYMVRKQRHLKRLSTNE